MPTPSYELVAIVVVAMSGVLSLPWRSLAVSESWQAVSSFTDWISRAAGRAIIRRASRPVAAHHRVILPDPAPAPPARTGNRRSTAAGRPAMHPAFRTFTTAS